MMKWVLVVVLMLFALFMLLCPVSAHAQQVPLNTTCNQYTQITWNMENTTGVEGFKVYQSQNPIVEKPASELIKVLLDSWNPLGTVIVPLTDGPTYFRVTAFGADIESDLSNEIGCMYTKVVGVDLWRIVTANDDKGSDGPTFLTFKVNVESIVYVMHDMRILQKPVWLSEFTQTREVMVTSDNMKYQVYMKEFPAGLVTLGGNSSGGQFSMYGVAVLGKVPDSKITEAKTPNKTYGVVPFNEGLMYADRSYTIATVPNLLTPGLKLVIPQNLRMVE